MAAPSDNDAKTTQPRLRFTFSFHSVIAVAALCLSIAALISIYVQSNQGKANNTAISHAWQQFQVNSLSKAKLLEAQLNQHNNHLQVLDRSVDQLAMANNNSFAARTLANASFLIHTADLTLAATHNTGQAISILSLAQNTVKKIGSDDFFTLQQALTKDINQLKKADDQFQPNLVISKLNTIQDRVNALTFYQTKNFHPQKKTDTTAQHTPHWYNPIVKILSGFKGLIIIRHHQNLIPPIRSQNQMQTIQVNISLKIALAQWAIIRKNQTLYHSSMTFIQRWLTALMPGNPSVDKIKQTVDQLANLSIHPHYSSTLSSLAVINELLSQYKTESLMPTKKTKPAAAPKRLSTQVERHG